jgi:putative aminopeptidase FrvX
MEERLKKLIEDLVAIPGPSGQEDLVAQYMQEQFKPFADECWIDKAGNSIAKFNGTSGRSIAVTGHMDEVYCVVEQIKDGLVYVKVACTLDPTNLDSVPVNVLTQSGKIIPGVFGSTTIHLKKWEKPCELFIDVGGETEDILPGDPVIYAPNLFWMNDHIVASKALDDRHSCAVLIQLAEMFKKNPPKDTVYLVGTRMEEICMHAGARYIAKTLPCDMYIAIDTNYGYDPKLPESKSWKIGDGPVIRRWERCVSPQTICFPSRRMTAALGKAGEELAIPFGYDIAETFTDSSGIYIERPDAEVCGINVARRYSHSAHEVVDIRDVAGCRDIVYTAIQKYL